MLGSFQENWLYALFGGLGVILGAVYMLYLVYRVFYGPITHEANENIKDLTRREKVTLYPLVIMIFVMGIYPRYFTEPMRPAINKIITQVQAAKDRQEARQAQLLREEKAAKEKAAREKKALEEEKKKQKETEAKPTKTALRTAPQGDAR